MLSLLGWALVQPRIVIIMQQQQEIPNPHNPSISALSQRLQKSIERSQRKLLLLQQQIQTRKNTLVEEQRKKIEERIQGLKEEQQKRKKALSESERKIREIRAREQEVTARLVRRDLREKWQKAKKQQQILKQREKLLQPINFREIYLHQYQYLKQHSLNPPARPPAPLSTSTLKTKHSAPTPASTFSSHRKHIKSMIQKRNEYGQKVQKLYHNVKIQTEPCKYDVIDEEIRQERERMYRREARRRRKSKCPEVKGDMVGNMRREIQRVRDSGKGIDEKFRIIDGMSKSYIGKYEETGKQYALELAAQANLALAQLYLSQK